MCNRQRDPRHEDFFRQRDPNTPTNAQRRALRATAKAMMSDRGNTGRPGAAVPSGGERHWRMQ